jgi:hypothetical protein
VFLSTSFPPNEYFAEHTFFLAGPSPNDMLGLDGNVGIVPNVPKEGICVWLDSETFLFSLKVEPRSVPARER